MTKIDPIIAVKDVEASSKWYQSVFHCRSMHGGTEFDILVNADNEVLICLHEWNAHEHPTMMNPDITPGNGLILYFRTPDMDEILKRVIALDYPFEKPIAINENSRKREFSLRDPDGYYLTITEFHRYEG